MRRGNVRVTPPAFKCVRLNFPAAEVPGATPYGDHHITTGRAGVHTETSTGHPQIRVSQRVVRGRSKFYQLGQSLFQQNTEHPCRTAPFERHSLAVPPWNACSRAASARTAGSAEVGRAAKPSRHLVRPAGRIEHGSPDSILPPRRRPATAPAHTFCHPPPCRVKVPYLAIWPARTVFSSREEIIFLAGGTPVASAQVNLYGCRRRVPCVLRCPKGV